MIALALVVFFLWLVTMLERMMNKDRHKRINERLDALERHLLGGKIPTEKEREK